MELEAADKCQIRLLISISHFTNLPHFFIMRLHSIRISHFTCAWGWSEAGNFSHFRILLSSGEVVSAVLFLSSYHQLIKFHPNVWAGHLDLSTYNHYVCPGHILRNGRSWYFQNASAFLQSNYTEARLLSHSSRQKDKNYKPALSYLGQAQSTQYI